MEQQKLKRRDFLKVGSITALAGSAALMTNPVSVFAKPKEGDFSPEITLHPDFPNEISDAYKPFKQVNNIFNQAFFNLDEELGVLAKAYFNPKISDKPGFRQLDFALSAGANAVSRTSSDMSQTGIPNLGYFSWDQKTEDEKDHLMDVDYLDGEKYEFATKSDATAAIKRAARLYGAGLVGITQRDKRWDYSEFHDPYKPEGEQYFGWEEFPFKPKSVIVMAFEMDYEASATSPSLVSAAAAGEGYSAMTKTAYQLAVFLRRLGYNAIASGNDLGLNVPYAVAAGLGEGSRMGTLVSFKYGPRVRISKVYTDFDFTEYDSPISFGVQSFCERCKRCADACPSKAISLDKEPSLAPPDSKNRPYNNTGAKKWYMDGKKCFEYWVEAGNDCAACITSCPYNKPDFWHHRLVDTVSAVLPGPVHSFMREMDIIFGYGETFNEDAVGTFYKNSKSRQYNGH